MIDQHKIIEELWYTWSDIGLDTIRAGFRVRAASESLQDIRSPRMQHLDRYLRYSLPQGVDPTSTAPSIAPISLSFVIDGQERLLIHKVYTGQDGVGRYGAFFIHLLASLPNDFSALTAISLWHSPLWQNSDASLPQRRSTQLPARSLIELLKTIPPPRMDTQTQAIVEQYLPYVIESYLGKKSLEEKKNALNNPQQIYIAASDEQIAHLIRGLTHSLPTTFHKDLTFSTYEPDVTVATTEIVGTCWLSVPQAVQDTRVANLLPVHYYRDKIALNCYTNTASPLPHVEAKALAEQFARDATHYVLHNIMQEEFTDLLKTANSFPDLTVAKFLALYESLIIQAQNPSQENIELVLSPRSASDLMYSAKMLAKPGYQNGIINLAFSKADWWQSFAKNKITLLQQKRSQIPELSHALSLLAQKALPQIVALLKEASASTKKTRSLEQSGQSEANLRFWLELLRTTAPANIDPGIWSTLLYELVKIKGFFPILGSTWDIYSELMMIWGQYVQIQDTKLIQPLLALSWNQFGDFLSLSLPVTWRETAVQMLQKSPLQQDLASQLGRSHYTQIEGFFQQLVQYPQGWQTAKALLLTLNNAGYPHKMPLLFLLLGSSHVPNEKEIALLLHNVNLTPEQQTQLLLQLGPHYIVTSKSLCDMTLKMFGSLSKQVIYQEKTQVLTRWFDAPQIATWLTTPPTGEDHLKTVLAYANLNPSEISWFFQQYGQRFVPLYPRSAFLLSLFEKYAQDALLQDRLTLLSFWLPQQLDPQTFEHLLSSAHLSLEEQRLFLEHFGIEALRRYPNSQLLILFLKEMLDSLRTNIDIFISQSKNPSSTEVFLDNLRTVQFPSDLQQRVYLWTVIGKFVRNPVDFFQRDRVTIAKNLGNLLQGDIIPQPHVQEKLMHLLALAVLGHPDQLATSVEIVRPYLLNQNLIYLLYDLAETANAGIVHKEYLRSLFIPCTAFALYFKKKFQKQSEQEYFIQSFLDTLFWGTDERILDWTDKEVKKSFDSSLYMDWQQYRSYRITVDTLPKPSRFTRVHLWWERRVAFNQMQQVLEFESTKEEMMRVAMDYMTTLTCYPNEIPASWEAKANEAIDFFNSFEEQSWQHSEDSQPTSQRSTGEQSVSEQPTTLISPPEHPLEAWWKRNLALLQMDLTLRSGRIGKIVRVATEQMVTLEKNHKSVPQTWWDQIAFAFQFYSTWEEAQEKQDEATTEALLQAVDLFNALVAKRQPVPKFTAHEKMRIEQCIRFLAGSKSQQMRLLNKQWAPVSLQSAAVAQPAQVPSEKSQQKTRRGLFSALLKR